MIIIISILLVTILLLKIGLDIKIKDIKKVKDIAYDNKLNKIIKKVPNNTKICKRILDILNNKHTKIEENIKSETQTSLYLIRKDKILIGNINNTFTRVQTIAHECIHSVQNKKILIFNYIFSNIYIIFFLLINILTIFKVITDIKVISINIIILIILGFIYFIIRGFLETEAMIKAEYIAKLYFEDIKILNEKDIDLIIEKYKELNKIGINLYNFILATKCILKTIIYCVIILVFL